MEDVSKYAHSPAHLAVARRDHDGLRRIVAALPPLPRAGEVTTEEESLAAEAIADTVSAVIDRRDVPRRETPLHLAVKLRDPISADILVSVGADVSLQNGKGWSALQEAVWRREERIAMIIYRQSQPLSWAKWCRRLPRIVSSIKRIQDFYMEITFHFESSVIPFISRIAPSDTYRIWKRGPNLRADMTLAGFDGFKIKRSDNTVLFLGEGAPAEGGRPVVSAGSLLVLSHKNKEITNALEGEGSKPTEAQVAHKVAQMSRTNMYRPGIDVTKAQLVPHLNWRRQERTEMVGNWKAKVYDMHHVMLILKSRTVPGATTNQELNAAGNDEKTKDGDLDNILTPEEKMQLDLALQDQSKGLGESDSNGATCELSENPRLHGTTKDKKSRFGSSNKKASKTNGDDAKKKNTKLLHKNGDCKSEEIEDINKRKEKRIGKKKPGAKAEPNKTESEFKNGLRPVLWLTPDFPLKTDELLPLLDVLANKGKAVRRLRELLTTKLPLGTFPVKIAIPIVPTIRVIVTFTKFEKVQTDDEFATPPSSPTYFPESKTKKAEGSGSWYSWVRGGRAGSLSDRFDGPTSKDEVDPFNLPSDYVWIDISEKMRRMKARRKAKSK